MTEFKSRAEARRAEWLRDDAQFRRNAETLESFIRYARANPDMRFWQAVRNWSGQPFILASGDLPTGNQQDTFQWKGRDG
jgi:hypothetical protein